MRFGRVGEESGQVAPLVAVTLLGLMAVTALVVDGGILFSMRRNLQALADGAARAGAMIIDEDDLRRSGGEIVQLDPDGARVAVRRYLEETEFEGAADIEVDSASVTVRLSEESPTVLLSVIGVKRFDVGALATARPRSEG